jgi:hypothetical protein
VLLCAQKPHRPPCYCLPCHVPILPVASAVAPLADVALRIPGAGRLAGKAAESVSNPKERRRAREEREAREREEREAAEARAAEEEAEAAAALQQQQQEQQQQQQQVHAAGATADGAAVEAHTPAAGVEGSLPEEATAEAANAAAAAAALRTAAATAESGEYTEIEEELAPVGLLQRVSDTAASLRGTPFWRGAGIGAALFLGATLIIAIYRSWEKYSTPEAQRRRVVRSKFTPQPHQGLCRHNPRPHPPYILHGAQPTTHTLCVTGAAARTRTHTC